MLTQTDKGIDDSEQGTIVLTRKESLRLLELIENPPPRNEKFKQAMQRYQEEVDNAIVTT